MKTSLSKIAVLIFYPLVFAALAVLFGAVPTPGGNVGVAINPSGDYAFLNVDNNGAVIIAGNGGGDVVGPASATANAVTRYSGTTGKLLKDSAVFVTDAGLMGIGNASPAVALDVTGAALASSSIKSSSATAGVGYATGAGGSVTQLTSKATGVTLNKVSGQIVTSNSTLNNGEAVSFTFTNSTIAATDVIVLNIASGSAYGGGEYNFGVDSVSAGSCRVYIAHRAGGGSGPLAEALTFNFAVIKAVAN